MSDRERRLKYVLSILEADPVVSVERIAEMCRVGVSTIKGDLRHIEKNASKSETKRLMEMRKIGLKRIEYEKRARKRKEEGYVTEYDLLEFLKKGKGVGKIQKELAELLSEKMKQKVKEGQLHRFISRLVEAGEDETNPKRKSIRVTLFKYGNSLRQKPNWWHEWKDRYPGLVGGTPRPDFSGGHV